MATFPAVAAGTVFEGSGGGELDPSLSPNRDVTRLGASYDDSGRLSATITLRGAAPTATTDLVGVMFGSNVSNGSCSEPTVLVLAGFNGSAVWDMGDVEGDAKANISDKKVSLDVKDKRLARKPFRCATAFTATDPGPNAGGTAQVVDVLDSAIHLTPRPVLKPKLKLKMNAPASAKPGRTVRIMVKVTNSGRAKARTVKLRVQGRRGVTVRPARKLLGSISPGKSRRVRLAAKVARSAPGRISVKARASGRGGISASAQAGIKVSRPRPSRPSQGAGGNLAGKYFWHTESQIDRGWVNSGIAFVDARWAYRGFPDAGLPSCRRRTAEGDSGEGCLRYSYNRRTGRIKVGKETGKYSRGGLSLGDDSYQELTIPKAGSRFSVSLIHRDFEGICGSITGCWTYSLYLTLTPKGNFALSSSSLGTMGGSGFPFTASWTAPPDEYGRYRISGRGRIVFNYADGHREARTIGLEQNSRGRPSPGKEGLLLNSLNFYNE
ncbi:MAG: hypothetical protein J0H66_04085 [Solirubrobacterales bacterium]|nr:hypothetical protein [Solirubrobacterales bacterium]